MKWEPRLWACCYCEYWAELPRAWTPLSVRDAPTVRTSARKTRDNAFSTSPCSVRTPFRVFQKNLACLEYETEISSAPDFLRSFNEMFGHCLYVTQSCLKSSWIQKQHKKHSISTTSPLTASASQQNQYHRMPKPNTTASKALQWWLPSSPATLTPVALSLLSLLLWECFPYFPPLFHCFAAWQVQSNKRVHSNSCSLLRLNLAPNPNISMKPAQGPYPSERTGTNRPDEFLTGFNIVSHCE